jgi:hypothetical protein
MGEVVRSTVEETSNAMRTLKPAVFAEPSGTSGLRRGRIRGRVLTSGSYRRKRVKSRRKCRSCATCRLRRRPKAEQVPAKLKDVKLADAAEHVRTGTEETLFYYAFPREHWRSRGSHGTLLIFARGGCSTGARLMTSG